MAERLLDSNSTPGNASSNSLLPENSEYILNLRQNIDDCLGVLGTLNVGLDVNPRFHDVEAFEATKELTVFDLLDIRLGELLMSCTTLNGSTCPLA